MNRRKIVTVCGTVLLIAAVVGVVVAPRERRQTVPRPDVPVAASPAEVRVKAAERKGETLDLSNALVSAGVLTFVSCLVFALFRFVSLCRERRRAMACSGIALYVASASTVVLGMLYVVL